MGAGTGLRGPRAGAGAPAARGRAWPARFGLADCRTVVLDGANIAWAYGTAEALAGRSPGGVIGPKAEGLVAALRHPPFAERGLQVVAFIPRDYVEGRLWEVCNGCRDAALLEDEADKEGDAELLEDDGGVGPEVGPSAGAVDSALEPLTGSGAGRWRNRVLHALVESGQLLTVERSSEALARKRAEIIGRSRGPGKRIKARVLKKHGGRKGNFAASRKARAQKAGKLPKKDGSKNPRSRDDLLLLRHAQEVNAWVVSNDRYRDHKSVSKRGWRGWVMERRLGFEFNVGADGDLTFDLKANKVFDSYYGGVELEQGGQIKD